MDVGANIRYFRSLLPPDVELVAVSKFHPAEMILEAYNAGQKTFGESRVKEFLEKREALPSDIRWHFIGHLQTNKVRPIIGKTFLIESVDSEKLLELIEAESTKAGVITNVLLQVHVAEEETKFGFYPEEIVKLLNNDKIKSLKSTRIKGLMGMATNTDEETRIRKDFSVLHNLFLEIKKTPTFCLPDFKYLSMGMSGDWKIAVSEGSNIIRIGSSIFGERTY